MPYVTRWESTSSLNTFLSFNSVYNSDIRKNEVINTIYLLVKELHIFYNGKKYALRLPDSWNCHYSGRLFFQFFNVILSKYESKQAIWYIQTHREVNSCLFTAIFWKNVKNRWNFGFFTFLQKWWFFWLLSLQILIVDIDTVIFKTYGPKWI